MAVESDGAVTAGSGRDRGLPGRAVDGAAGTVRDGASRTGCARQVSGHTRQTRRRPWPLPHLLPAYGEGGWKKGKRIPPGRFIFKGGIGS